MKIQKFYIIVAVVAVFLAALGLTALGGRADLDEVRTATEGFQSVADAEAAGYVNVNVDECVASPEGAMGFHFVNFDLVDLDLDPAEPEIMVFIPDADGSLRLGAVEYAVPIEAWDAVNEGPPSLLGQTLNLNPELGLYVLHAWLYEDNPSGVFVDWNLSVTCEA